MNYENKKRNSTINFILHSIICFDYIFMCINKMKHTREHSLKGLGDLVMDKYRVKYIYQYLFLIAVIFVGVPLFLGGYTTSGLCLNLAVVHVLFVFLVRSKEKERTERIRKKRLRELTQ